MPATPNFALRYPQLSDTPNIPRDVQYLASDVDAALTPINARKVILYTEPAQVAFGSLAAGSSVTMASVAITDPGFAYHLEADGAFDWGSAGAANSVTVSGQMQLDTATFDTASTPTNRFAWGKGSNAVANVSNDVWTPIVRRSTKTLYPAGLTGGHTVFFVVKNSGGSSAVTIYNGPGGNGGVAYTFQVAVVPA